jgi:hypothetical protein
MTTRRTAAKRSWRPSRWPGSTKPGADCSAVRVYKPAYRRQRVCLLGA